MAKNLKNIDRLAEEKMQEIQEWTLEKAGEVCPSCVETCCGDRKQIIGSFEGDEIRLFTERGLPVINIGEFDDASAVIWTAGRINRAGGRNFRIKDSSGRALPEPALVAYPSSFRDRFGAYFLYTGSRGHCPFYDDKSKICQVHEDPQRPYVCRFYPVFTVHIQSQPEIGVGISKRCSGFNNPKVLEEFKRTFSIEPPIKKNNGGNLAFLVKINSD